jgi:hypothetical protein
MVKIPFLMQFLSLSYPSTSFADNTMADDAGKDGNAKQIVSGYPPSAGDAVLVGFTEDGDSGTSPTSVMDPHGATPSSSGTNTIRCVCNDPYNEGWMIQWYVLAEVKA